jgi:hypothetical protein
VAIQFCRDGTPFGEGTVDASGMFGAVAGSPVATPAPAAMPGLPFPGAAAAPAVPSFPAPGLPPFLQG